MRASVLLLAALLALALAAPALRAPAVLGQPPALEFADWTAISGNSQLTGTLLGHTITLSGGYISSVPGSVLDGKSSLFAGASFSPPLATSDAPEFRATDPPYGYTLTFGAPVQNPVFHLGSLGSTITFPAGTQITRLSGQAGFAVSGNTVTRNGGGDVNGSVRLAGVFSSISFAARQTVTQLDGIAFQVGATAPPVLVPTPVPSPTPTPTGGGPSGGLAPGNLPPIAGVRVVTQITSGHVFVQLPTGQDFVPLRGAASVPVGSVVDARKGRLTFRSAADGRGHVESARLAAGIFRIRQARAKRGQATPTDFVLATPAGLGRACASRRTRPAKGIVRTLVVAAKGTFRTVGKRGVVTGRNATWRTSDRCDGTVTRVRRGHVSVRSGLHTLRVAAGRSYRIRARLFAAPRPRR